jgi:hypothetical protein
LFTYCKVHRAHTLVETCLNSHGGITQRAFRA